MGKFKISQRFKYMKEQLNAFAVCHNTCFRCTRQFRNLLKSATSNKNNENDNYNYYYYNSNKITIMRCGLEVFFGGFRQISVIGWISVFLVTAFTAKLEQRRQTFEMRCSGKATEHSIQGPC